MFNASDRIETSMKNAEDEAQATPREAQHINTLGIVLAAVAGTVVTTLIVRGILRSLGVFARTIEPIACGELGSPPQPCTLSKVRMLPVARENLQATETSNERQTRCEENPHTLACPVSLSSQMPPAG